MNQDVYRFTNSIDYLAFAFERKKVKNPKFSLRAWASQLDFKNPAFLSQVLSRKRKLKLDLAKKISRNLRLSAAESKYLEALVLLENAKTSVEKNLIYDLLFSLRESQEKQPVPISLDVFKFVSDWHHVVILEILNLKNYDGSLDFIESCFSKTLSPSQIQSAIERLTRLGLVEKTNGKFRRAKESTFLLDTDVPSEAVCSFHSQMVQKALLAIEEQKVNQRELRASTVCLCKEDLPMVHKMIADLHRKIAQISRNKDGEAVYQLNSQFFDLLPSYSKGSSL